jgi:hypothetical protein
MVSKIINRKKCIKNLDELIEVIDKESDELYNAFYKDHPQQDWWSDEANKEFKKLKESRFKIKDNAENLMVYFSKYQ